MICHCKTDGYSYIYDVMMDDDDNPARKDNMPFISIHQVIRKSFFAAVVVTTGPL